MRPIRPVEEYASVVLYCVVRDWQRDREVGGACEVDEVEVDEWRRSVRTQKKREKIYSSMRTHIWETGSVTEKEGVQARWRRWRWRRSI
jgi:hypothetical protein